MHKRNIIIIIGVIVLAIIIGLGLATGLKEKDNKKIYSSPTSIKSDLKESKYSLDEMYSYIKSNSRPNDKEFKEIIFNWYDYFSKDTPFMNYFGETYNYQEYTDIMADIHDWDEDKLIHALIDWKRSSFFEPISGERVRY